MTTEIENLIQQIETETGISANTKTRIGNVLRKISEQVDLAVPYTGATQNVDLNGFEIQTKGVITDNTYMTELKKESVSFLSNDNKKLELLCTQEFNDNIIKFPNKSEVTTLATFLDIPLSPVFSGEVSFSKTSAELNNEFPNAPFGSIYTENGQFLYIKSRYTSPSYVESIVWLKYPCTIA